MKRKTIYENHIICMAMYTILLLIDTACVFMSARYLASFVELFQDFSYEKGLQTVMKLGIVYMVQLLFFYIKNRYWTIYRECRTNKLECAVYRKYLEVLPNPGSEGKLAVICGKDIPECVVFFTEKLPAAIQAVIGVMAYSIFLFGKENGIWVAALLLALGAVQFLPPLLAEKYLVQNYIQAGQEEEKVRQELIAGLSGILTIKMLNLHDWFLDCYRRRQQEFRKVGECAAGTSSIQSALQSGTNLVQQLGFLLLGGLAVAGGLLSLETLIEGYVLSGSFYGFMAKLGFLKAEYGTCRAAEGRISQMFEEENIPCLFEELKMELPGRGLWLVKGENGAGKSTLLAILSGCRQNDAQILQNNKLMSRETRLAETAWCPQTYINLTGSFQELVNLIPADVMDTDRLHHCLGQFGMESEITDKSVNTLSGGQQKKLMLSLAFAKKSSLLLLDEPEVSLDRQGIEILKKLLKGEKRPVLLVSHVSDFDDMATGIIRVKGGRVFMEAV